MKVGIGSDHNAYEMKALLKEYIEELGYEVTDYGCENSCIEVDYPKIAFKVSDDIRANKINRAVLVCGTGIGMAIAAGKVPGIRAALCHDTYSAERAQKSNNAQILTMGARVIGIELAKKIVKTYLTSDFPGGNSARKIQQIMDKEKELSKREGAYE